MSVVFSRDHGTRRAGTRLALLMVGGLLALTLAFALGRMSGAPSVATGTAHPHALYTCGMHPEVIRDEPGKCPKCGMPLIVMDPDRARAILAARGELPAPTAEGSGTERRIRFWRAPMDPTYVRNEPGKSPMGMDLVPVYEDEVAGGPTVRIDPVTEQSMGVRYDVVRSGPLERTVRTVGLIQYDEDSLATATTRVDGWVEKLYVSETGTQVHAGSPLFDLYAPQLYSAQEEFLTALRGIRDARARGAEDTAVQAERNLAAARDRLRLYDISEDQIVALEKEEKVRRSMTIRARVTGIVIHRGVVEGDYIKAGTPTHKTADLSTVWVMGRVFESDLPFVGLGQEAKMRLDYLPGRTWRGRVTYVYPYLEPGTREIAVRMEFHNPGYDLKPGMYATIELHARIAERAVLVPASAVILAGDRAMAFVALELGKFEPRRVAVGVRTADDEFQVLEGLAPGEKVVVSGQFLFDSESRLREATLKMLNPKTTGAGAAATAQAQPTEETATAAASARWVCPMPSHTGILYDAPGSCPLCGMTLVPVSGGPGEPIDHYTCPMPEHYHVHLDAPGKCPECGMTLIPVTRAEEERFRKAAEGRKPGPTLYTCPAPAHADVVSDKTGACPKCGMALVPTASVPHGRQAEERWRHIHMQDGHNSTTPSGFDKK